MLQLVNGKIRGMGRPSRRGGSQARRNRLQAFQQRAFANSFGIAYNPDRWARESVLILLENMVAAGVVHRDFEEIFSTFGQIVNTRQPGEFTAKRKERGDSVTVQDASATNIQVPLDQHAHVSFSIEDIDETVSFKSLVDEYIAPASQAMARFADQVVLYQAYQFLENQAGSLNGLTISNAVGLITSARSVLNTNKAHVDGRNVIWGTDAESLILQNSVFHEADKRGDTQGLRDASLGHKFGMDHWMGQNAIQVEKSDHAYQSGAVNETAANKGDLNVTIDGITSLTGDDIVTAGQWVTVAGKIHQISATDSATDPTLLTLAYALHENVADDAVVEICDKGHVDFAAGYASGYSKGILVDNASGALGVTPQVGQLVSFGATTPRYAIIEVETGATEHTITLDRPLAAALSDNDIANYGPAGGINLGLHRNAITLAIRPLKSPPSGTGAQSGTSSFNNATNRVTFTYDGNAQSLLTTFDYLLGVKVLDNDLGVVVLS